MDVVKLIDPVQDPRWDEFVIKHPNGCIYHLSGWKQVLEKSYKHMKGHYFVLIGENNKINAALPIFEVKSWIMGNRLVSIPFATVCDPLITKKEEFNKLFKSAFNLSEKLKSSFIEIRALKSSSLVQEDVRLGKSNLYKNQYLPLDNELDCIMKSFHRTCVRKNIKRAIKSNLRIKKADNLSEVYNFYQLYIMTRKNLGLPSPPFNFFKLIWETFSVSKSVFFLIAELNNYAISGIMLFKYKDRISAEYLGWDKKFNDVRPTVFIYYEAIKFAHSEGSKVIDFGRTSINNKGLMDFKRHWGTKIVDLPQFYYPKRKLKKFVDKEKSLSYKAINSISKKVPGPIFKLLGDFIYCHMG